MYLKLDAAVKFCIVVKQKEHATRGHFLSMEHEAELSELWKIARPSLQKVRKLRQKMATTSGNQK